MVRLPFHIHIKLCMIRRSIHIPLCAHAYTHIYLCVYVYIYTYMLVYIIHICLQILIDHFEVSVTRRPSPLYLKCLTQIAALCFAHVGNMPENSYLNFDFCMLIPGYIRITATLFTNLLYERYVFTRMWANFKL